MQIPKLVDVHVGKLRARNPRVETLQEWMLNPRHLYIGRASRYVGVMVGSKWQNPYPVGARCTLEESLRLYERHVRDDLLKDLHELCQVEEIGCWCCENPGVKTTAPKCHGEVLINLLYEYHFTKT